MQAWSEAPESFKKKAEAAGLKPHIDEESHAVNYEEDWSSGSYTPDMAEEIDTFIDMLVERHPGNEALVRSIAACMMEPMKAEADKQAALATARIACYLVKTEKGYLLARVHALLHAIPRLALVNGLSSMRHSARECGLSVEWVRRSRNQWCDILGIKAPLEGTKPEECCKKLKQAALTRHWRNQKFIVKPIQTSKPIQCPQNPTLSTPPSNSHSSSQLAA